MFPSVLKHRAVTQRQHQHQQQEPRERSLSARCGSQKKAGAELIKATDTDVDQEHSMEYRYFSLHLMRPCVTSLKDDSKVLRTRSRARAAVQVALLSCPHVAHIIRNELARASRTPSTFPGITVSPKVEDTSIAMGARRVNENIKSTYDHPAG